MNYLRLILIIIFSSSSISCNKKTGRNQDYLPPLEISISKDLESDYEIYNLIISAEENVNRYSDKIEEIIINGEKLFNTNSDKSSLSSELKKTNVMINFYSNCTNLQNVTEQFNKHIIDLKVANKLNEKQALELRNINKQYKHRIDILEKKYEDFYKR